MRVPIFTKLFISLFMTSILLVIGMTFFVSYSFKSGFQEYLNQQEKKEVGRLANLLSGYYSADDGWQTLRMQPEIWAEMFVKIGMPFPGEHSAPERHPSPNIELGPGPDRGPEHGRERHEFPPRNAAVAEEFGPISHRLFLENKDHQWVAGVYFPDQEETSVEWFREPIKQSGKVVGWIVLKQKDQLSGPLVGQFYAQQQSNLIWIIGLAGLASLIVALGLVRHFLLPLKRLQKGANALSEGDYSFTFEGGSNDEFGELANRFQYLAGSLKRQKESREQWLVDISHELRTPIAVLRSELEAIQDGIRKPEMKRMDSMHHQVMGLRRLVDDLYLLSKTDAGGYQLDVRRLDIIALVQSVANRFEHRIEQKGLVLTRALSAPVFIMGDEKTLEQLCVNLFENSLRYTDAPGTIKLAAQADKDDVVLLFEDSSPGVEEVHLDKLFARLYRVDQSRSRSHGGSGLGLSICQNIVMMHGGSIVAKRSELGGLVIEVRLKREINNG
ncbi:ATP-binding protein [Marinomonas pollencensis]|uniref:histidine kinase n=1 Tax=Marinomonas pollencensis TaxID=491954 RepID=A0A3E0DLJ4_9GAMM|nr:ATP-binding protein [Marinomonas pollencensis]REG82383.1 two-component system sensor histidine kinase BaeS [Marinomonas pollencensis]